MKYAEQLLKKGAIKHIKKYGFKQFLKDWKYNFIMLQTPEHLLNQEIWGYIGSIVGLIIAIIFMIYSKRYYLLVVLAFSILILYSALKQSLQKKQSILDIKNMYQEEQ